VKISKYIIYWFTPIAINKKGTEPNMPLI